MLVEASSILEPGRRALKAVLPTVMASGTKSWNTAEVVVDAGGNRGPLLTVEMERQMGLEEGFTDIPGVTEAQRHHQIGNAFHAGIMEHVLQSWVDYAVAERRLDRQRGFPVADKRLVAWGYRGVRVGQARVPGPKKEADDTAKWLAAMRGRRQQARRARSKRVLNTCGQATAGKQRCVAAVAQRKVEQKVSALKLGVKATASARSARWRQLIPEVKQQVVAGSQSIMQRVGGYESWGSAKRSLITDRQARNSTMSLDSSLGFRELAGSLRRDFVIASKSDETWKQYDSWKKCFWAWLDAYDLDFEPSQDEETWSLWVEVLSDAVAVMAICYAVGTLDVMVSAVSCYMQHGGMASPFKSKEFSAMMEGIRRWKGLGKQKKPPVEPWHVRAILSGKQPSQFGGGDFSELQFRQAKVLLVVGWQLFTRPQDFYELEVCDFRFLLKEMEVTIRYAKNDVKGLTRAPRLAEAGDEWCPVRLVKEYFEVMQLEVHPDCDKVPGEPARCSKCPAAFPPIWKHGGVQRGRRIPRAQVSLRIKSLFLGLAEQGHMSVEDARMFSGKSCRCGGVSSAAGLAVRDGVLQGHGGWLTRQSLRHYDLMKPGEKALVSAALNKAVRNG